MPINTTLMFSFSLYSVIHGHTLQSHSILGLFKYRTKVVETVERNAVHAQANIQWFHDMRKLPGYETPLSFMKQNFPLSSHFVQWRHKTHRGQNEGGTQQYHAEGCF